jgi:hypothetical protein
MAFSKITNLERRIQRKKRLAQLSTETRMMIHIAALKADWEQRGSYKEFTRLALEQEKPSAASPKNAALSNRPAGAAENCRREPVPTTRLFGRILTTETGSRARLSKLSINIAAKSINSPGHSLRRRLEVVTQAWNEFQTCCRRDAIYPFLQRVFSLVKRYERRGRAKRLLRNILKLTGLRADADTNIYALIIRVAAGSDRVDRKQSSKLSRVLRFAAEYKPKRVSLRAFIQARGGLNKVADLYARHLGRHRRS